LPALHDFPSGGRRAASITLHRRRENRGMESTVRDFSYSREPADRVRIALSDGATGRAQACVLTDPAERLEQQPGRAETPDWGPFAVDVPEARDLETFALACSRNGRTAAGGSGTSGLRASGSIEDDSETHRLLRFRLAVKAYLPPRADRNARPRAFRLSQDAACLSSSHRVEAASENGSASRRPPELYFQICERAMLTIAEEKSSAGHAPPAAASAARTRRSPRRACVARAHFAVLRRASSITALALSSGQGRRSAGTRASPRAPARRPSGIGRPATLAELSPRARAARTGRNAIGGAWRHAAPAPGVT